MGISNEKLSRSRAEVSPCHLQGKSLKLHFYKNVYVIRGKCLPRLRNSNIVQRDTKPLSHNRFHDDTSCVTVKLCQQIRLPVNSSRVKCFPTAPSCLSLSGSAASYSPQSSSHRTNLLLVFSLDIAVTTISLLMLPLEVSPTAPSFV